MHNRTIEMVDWEMVRILRTKTDAERLAIAHGMWRFARNAIGSVLRSEHPEWDEHKVAAEVAKRMSHGTI